MFLYRPFFKLIVMFFFGILYRPARPQNRLDWKREGRGAWCLYLRMERFYLKRTYVYSFY